MPLVRSALGPEPVGEAAKATQLPAASHRRGKGEEANQMRMAAVGTVSTIEPFARTPDEVIDGVMREKAAQHRPRPTHKRAELLVGKVYITNDRTSPVSEIVFFANDRCDQEHLVAQLKGGVKAWRCRWTTW
jgi:hypothetical protein